MRDSYARELIKKNFDLLRDIRNGIKNDLNNKANGLYTCEVCGCYINPEYATKGDEIIKERLVNIVTLYPSLPTMEKYIYTPYYCKVHAPNVDKKGRKK